MIELNIDNYRKIKILDKFLQGHKGFVAGGCFKNILNNEHIKDIDVFFRNREDFSQAVQYFDTMTSSYVGINKRNANYIFIYQNTNIKAYKHIETGIVVELNQKIFGSPIDIISQFDFTITKIAYYKEANSGLLKDKLICTNDFFEHLFTKRLVIDDKIPFPMSTFERMIKYIKYGYMPCRETKMKIAKEIHNMKLEEIIANKSLYDGFD